MAPAALSLLCTHAVWLGICFDRILDLNEVTCLPSRPTKSVRSSLKGGKKLLGFVGSLCSTSPMNMISFTLQNLKVSLKKDLIACDVKELKMKNRRVTWIIRRLLKNNLDVNYLIPQHYISAQKKIISVPISCDCPVCAGHISGRRGDTLPPSRIPIHNLLPCPYRVTLHAETPEGRFLTTHCCFLPPGPSWA